VYGIKTLVRTVDSLREQNLNTLSFRSQVYRRGIRFSSSKEQQIPRAIVPRFGMTSPLISDYTTTGLLDLFVLLAPAGIIVCQLNHGEILMSRVNGDKARYNRERKKNIARREGIRQLLQAAGEKATAGKKAAAPAKVAASVER
jgi:hypothetical protein